MTAPAQVPTVLTDTTAHVVNQGFTSDQIELIKRTIAKGATNDELALFLHQCRRTGLDPLAKQIYFQKRLNRATGASQMTIILAIDGYRLIAHRTGQYAGMDETRFDDEEKPTKATVTVYKMVESVRCPFTATARWDQYYPGDKMGFMWNKMPHLMLEKCAEALALRKAFPAELSGLYTDEEMQQAGETPTLPPTVEVVTDAPPDEPPTETDAPPHQRVLLSVKQQSWWKQKIKGITSVDLWTLYEGVGIHSDQWTMMTNAQFNHALALADLAHAIGPNTRSLDQYNLVHGKPWYKLSKEEATKEIQRIKNEKSEIL